MNIYILIHNAIGDFLTTNGLLHFLSTLYDNVYIASSIISLEKTNNNILYLKELYKDCKNINVISYQHLLNISKTNKIIVINAMLKQNRKLKNNKNINLIDHDNWLEVDYIYKYKEVDYIDNSSKHYYNCGLNIQIRIDYFFYKRDHEKEDMYYKKILKNNNIEDNKYNIICEGKQGDGANALIDRKYIKNNNKIINIHHLVDNPLFLIKLLEEANEVHLIENSHCLMIYYMQSKQLMKIREINYHIYSRTRPTSQKDFYKMVLNPKLNNWKLYN